MTDIEIKKSLLSYPGDTIQEHLDSIGMSQKELAERMGRSVPKLNDLIKGRAPLTPETAQKLEYILDIPASFWLNLEAVYQAELLEIEKMEKSEKSKTWIKGFPLNLLKKMRLLPNTNKTDVLVEELFKFFRVAGPDEWSRIYEGSSLAFKIALKYTTNPKAISTWLRLGEIQAKKLKIDSFDKKKITNALPSIKILCYHAVDNWLEELQDICSSMGIALVYTPCISKAPIYGASRWIRNNSLPLIQLTDRHKDYNAFWFSFYHELAHIRFHNKSDIFISGLDNIEQDEKKEDEADLFASKMLISKAQWTSIERFPHHTPRIIHELSEKLKIHPSILVSQLQRRKFIKYNSLNNLKIKVKFDELVL